VSCLFYELYGKSQLRGRKKILLRADGLVGISESVLSLWGPKAMDGIVPLDVSFEVEQEKNVVRRLGLSGFEFISVILALLIHLFCRLPNAVHTKFL
jgi:hypothetical protein